VFTNTQTRLFNCILTCIQVIFSVTLLRDLHISCFRCVAMTVSSGIPNDLKSNRHETTEVGNY